MDILFTDEWQSNFDGWVSFHAEVDGKIVTNRIAIECLEDHFGENGGRSAHESAFAGRKSEIEEVTRFALERLPRNRFGGADITSEVVQVFTQAKNERRV